MSRSFDQVHLAQVRRSASYRIDRHVSAGVLDRGPEWAKAWFELSVRYSEGETAYLILPEAKIARFVEWAMRHHEVFELAKLFVGTRLTASVATPAPIGALISGFLNGDIEPPKRPPGPKSENTWGRNFIVYNVLIEMKEETELPITENRTQKGVRSREPVLSRILEEAIEASQMPNLRQSQIENIWTDTQKRDDFKKVHNRYLVSLLDDEADFVWV